MLPEDLIELIFSYLDYTSALRLGYELLSPQNLQYVLTKIPNIPKFCCYRDCVLTADGKVLQTKTLLNIYPSIKVRNIIDDYILDMEGNVWCDNKIIQRNIVLISESFDEIPRMVDIYGNYELLKKIVEIEKFAALDSSGDVWSITTPNYIKVAELHSIKHIYTTSIYTLALNDMGKLYYWFRRMNYKSQFTYEHINNGSNPLFLYEGKIVSFNNGSNMYLNYKENDLLDFSVYKDFYTFLTKDKIISSVKSELKYT